MLQFIRIIKKVRTSMSKKIAAMLALTLFSYTAIGAEITGVSVDLSGKRIQSFLEDEEYLLVLDPTAKFTAGAMGYKLSNKRTQDVYSIYKDNVATSTDCYDSDQARKIRMKTMNDGLNRKASSKVTAEELETRSIRHLAKLAISWQGVVENKKDLEFSTDAVFELLKKYAWIKEQCDEFIGDRGNFLKED